MLFLDCSKFLLFCNSAIYLLLLNEVKDSLFRRNLTISHENGMVIYVTHPNWMREII